jgi:EAL domain-containing protein (putative c-di-GMP-specific phosphodiesterase class I)/GGDEF domain-containing protein
MRGGKMLGKITRQTRKTFVAMSSGAKTGVVAATTLLALATASLVYATGGVQFAYLHLMYIPVVLSGLAFGVRGGVLAGIAGGLLLGPFMPLNTSMGAMQQPLNWIYRLISFALIGTLVGAGAQLLRRQLRELEWLHEHHPETGLLNLAGLLKELDDMMGNVTGRRELVLSIMQLNNFLEIQNTFGAAFGMRVLAQVIDRAQRLMPSGSLLALVQPDRLGSVIPGEEALQTMRERVEAAVKESYLVDGVPIHVAASIGVAHFPVHAATAEELLQKASIAMHWANSSRSAISLYDTANDRTSRENLILLGGLPDAIERGELQVWHQAKIALATDEVAGTEALLRWKHPQRGIVSPGSFIPQVEETTLINSVTQVMIAAAFADAGSWRAAGYRLRVSINLSVRNLRDHMLLDVLEQNARRNQLEPTDIELEITESAVMVDPDHCIRLIALLRDRGYGVSIDDFGTGHSSLAYLQKLRVSALKIDQAFVKTLASDSNNQKIVRAILHLAKSLGLETIAEGVDDERAVTLLREWGCDYGQGYGLHRPAPSQDFLRFVDERKRVQR